jgi:hypothetical protein
MSAFCDADASLATGAPFLAVAEQALFLLAFAFEAFGRTIGNADAFDASRLRGGLVLGGVECSISRQQMRRASEQGLMRLDSGYQQVGIIWPPRVDLVIDHDLVLRLLQFHHLAELIGLAGLALADMVPDAVNHANGDVENIFDAIVLPFERTDARRDCRAPRCRRAILPSRSIMMGTILPR